MTRSLTRRKRRLQFIFCTLLLTFNVCVSDAGAFTRSKVVYCYPMNGALYVHPTTDIGFTFSIPIDQNSLQARAITVIGAGGKIYNGTLQLSANGQTVIFSHAEAFHLGELITVDLGPLKSTAGNSTLPFSISFTIRKNFAYIDTGYHSDDLLFERQLHPELSSGKWNNLSPLELSPMIVTTDLHPTDGNIYIGPHRPFPYAAILDKHGIITSSVAASNTSILYNDFMPRTDSRYSYYDNVNSFFYIVDSNFSIRDSLAATKQYFTDEHEIRFLPDGSSLFFGNEDITMDMTPYGGVPYATVITQAILKYDREKNLVFEWRTIDHYKLTDATNEDLTASTVDFCHPNAIEIDADSNILLSCRSMDEITKIDHVTGNIIWRWGGKNNQFTSLNDTIPFTHQHAIRRTDQGTYTMLDNGNLRIPQYSRAVEYELDEKKKTAKKIWEYRHDPDIFARSMGYVERLKNKSTLIGWGENTDISVTEVDSNNTVQFEMILPNVDFTYRVYKYDTDYTHQKLGVEKIRSASDRSMNISCIPNPVTSSAAITYSTIKDGYITLSLYDALGRSVSNIYSGYLAEGEHEFNFDAHDLAGGAYILRAASGGVSSDMKIMVVK